MGVLIVLKRRTKRKLISVGIVLALTFVVLIAGADAGRWGGGWSICDYVWWC
jgi:ABC-type cobalt transport system substrate-binding protein